ADAPDPFPIDALPRACRAIVEHGAAAQGVDVGLWAVPLLPVLAGCIGNARTVRVKPGWHEPAVVWAATIAPSGAGKSPPLRELLRPVRDRDRELHERTLALQAVYEADLSAWRADRKAMPKPEPPPLLSVVIDDITIEAIAVRLQDNPRGLLMGIDELAGFLRAFDRYRGGGGGDEQRWLSIHGADPIKVDRKTTTASRIYVPRAAVSICSTIQPGIAARYLSAEHRESGLVARLLVAAPPVTAARWTENTIPTTTAAEWGRVCRSLLDITHDEDEPRALPLDDEARRLFVAFHDQNGSASLAAAQKGDGDLAAALSKLRGYAPRLALVLALARAAESGTAELLQVIDGESMRGAIDLVHYFESECRRLYARMAATTPSSRKAKVLARFRQGGADGASRTDIRDCLGRNARGEEISAIVDALVDEALIEPMERAAGGVGRPAARWRVIQ
ncbi:MAG: DUF3987 domain-containing protein, partial [Planctomycetes bacterium]|nr:DUF3987 domain-containing protein [Planctomycetota bacterium]